MNIKISFVSILSRFVYGQVVDFKTAAFGIKLYEFAHEMQIDTLKEQLVEFFKQTKPSNIFALLDLYKKTGNKVGLENCKKVREFFFFLSMKSNNHLQL
jgi:hypothetical protein